jgi:hypothetical protein
MIVYRGITQQFGITYYVNLTRGVSIAYVPEKDSRVSEQIEKLDEAIDDIYDILNDIIKDDNQRKV